MIYKTLKPRPRIKTHISNGGIVPNYKNGGLRNVKSAQRNHPGRNNSKMYASQPSPDGKQQVQSCLLIYF
jgi:hypothetical protein